MTKKTWWAMSAMAATLIVAAVGWIHTHHPTASPAMDHGKAPAMAPSSRPIATPGGAPAPLMAAKPAAGLPSSPLDSVAQPVFRADSHGNLVTDPQARLDIERIYALNGWNEALQKLHVLSSGLPSQARHQLKDLYQQYTQYAQAVAQAYPPGQDAETPKDLAKQLDGLHDLRQQYFGIEGAQAMFSEEERISRDLMKLMPPDPNMSMEEKAEHAQTAWKNAHPSPP